MGDIDTLVKWSELPGHRKLKWCLRQQHGQAGWLMDTSCWRSASCCTVSKQEKVSSRSVSGLRDTAVPVFSPSHPSHNALTEKKNGYCAHTFCFLHTARHSVCVCVLNKRKYTEFKKSKGKNGFVSPCRTHQDRTSGRSEPLKYWLELQLWSCQ